MKRIYITLYFLMLTVLCINCLTPGSNNVKNFTNIKHNEIVTFEIDVSKNEQTWSRLNFYVFIYLSFPAAEIYNPYLIHSRQSNPYKDIIITRQISDESVIITVSYTTDIKIILPEKNNLDENSDEIKAIKYLLEDMREYSVNGKHLHSYKK